MEQTTYSSISQYSYDDRVFSYHYVDGRWMKAVRARCLIDKDPCLFHRSLKFGTRQERDLPIISKALLSSLK